MSIFSWDRKQGIMNITKHYFYKGSLRVNEHFQYFTYLLSFKVFKYLQAQMKILHSCLRVRLDLGTGWDSFLKEYDWKLLSLLNRAPAKLMPVHALMDLLMLSECGIINICGLCPWFLAQSYSNSWHFIVIGVWFVSHILILSFSLLLS